MPITIRLERLSPAAATLVLTANDSSFRAKLTGPHCLYATTIEIAYPIGPTGRVTIPDPTWWDPESPFLYTVQSPPFEPISLGFRHCIFRDQQLIWNGQHLELRTTQPASITTEEFAKLRSAGFNSLNVAVEDVEAACAIADRIGMLIRGDAEPVGINPLIHPSLLP